MKKVRNKKPSLFCVTVDIVSKLTKFESILLYGSMLEAASFMKSDADVVTMYKERYNEAMLLLKQLGDAKDRQDAYRSGQVRYPVK